jgi:hypothetical protein
VSLAHGQRYIFLQGQFFMEQDKSQWGKTSLKERTTPLTAAQREKIRMDYKKARDELAQLPLQPFIPGEKFEVITLKEMIEKADC